MAWNLNPPWVELGSIKPDKYTSVDGIYASAFNKVVENLQYLYNHLGKADLSVSSIETRFVSKGNSVTINTPEGPKVVPYPGNIFIYINEKDHNEGEHTFELSWYFILPIPELDAEVGDVETTLFPNGSAPSSSVSVTPSYTDTGAKFRFDFDIPAYEGPTGKVALVYGSSITDTKNPAIGDSKFLTIGDFSRVPEIDDTFVALWNNSQNNESYMAVMQVIEEPNEGNVEVMVVSLSGSLTGPPGPSPESGTKIAKYVFNESYWSGTSAPYEMNVSYSNIGAPRGSSLVIQVTQRDTSTGIEEVVYPDIYNYTRNENLRILSNIKFTGYVIVAYGI